MGAVENAVAALQAGDLVVLPTDTVYGLCAPAHNALAISRINEMKRRPALAISIIAASTEALIECVPEFRLGWQTLLEEVFPGPYTLVLPNLKRRMPRLAVIDIGELPGTPSTVIDVSGASPIVLRNGAGDPKRVLDAFG
jgi:tRNA A37 threonylcarbamoyladenosine synthetase subunit TsaC/SUA5/YrdC